MIHVLIRHKVADFNQWKVIYDSHAGARQAGGFKELHLMRGIADPNEVVILFAADDLNKARAFSNSPGLRETMKKSGVIDTPDIYFLS